MAVLVMLLAVVVALLGVLVAGLLRSHAEILRVLHELGAGLDPDDAAPVRSVPSVHAPSPVERPSRAASDLSGVTPAGDTVGIAIVGAAHPTLVGFLTTGCTSCADFWSAFANLDPRRVPGGARLVVVLKGAEAESVAAARKLAPPDVEVVMSSEAWETYGVPVAPYFVYVDGPSGDIVGEGAAATWAQIVSLIERSLEEAGLDPRSGDHSGRRRRRNDAARETRIDRDLLSAGIEPGHPSLYPGSHPEDQRGG